MTGLSTAAADDPRFLAAVKMIERTGAREFQLRWQDDQEPTVWIAVAKHLIGEDGRPAVKGETHWQAGAGMTPYRAAFALAESLVDGGTCAHCGRPSGVTDDSARDADGGPGVLVRLRPGTVDLPPSVRGGDVTTRVPSTAARNPVD